VVLAPEEAGRRARLVFKNPLSTSFLSELGVHKVEVIFLRGSASLALCTPGTIVTMTSTQSSLPVIGRCISASNTS
jgi:hypothetical protein